MNFDFIYPNARRYRRLCYDVSNRLRRSALLWRFTIGCLSKSEAESLIWSLEEVAGRFPLLVLTCEDTLIEAHYLFHPHPALPALVDQACARVGRKWESYNDDLFNARAWALELVSEYAAQDGVHLLRRDDPEPADEPLANLSHV